MQAAVITFPGSNCDLDLLYVLRDVLQVPTQHLFHKETDLKGADLVCIPGGFSYGDYLRSGAIARFSPIMAEVQRHAERGGLVLGICNGFQILTEAGLLPGVLLRNESGHYQHQDVYLRPATSNSPLTQALEARPYRMPIAHAEGNYYADDATLAELEANNQVLFRYCDAAGQVTAEANPNGSLHNIAGVCNAGRNVMALMPHPERNAELLVGNADGRAVLESLLKTQPATV